MGRVVANTTAELPEIHSEDDIPQFANEAEEADFFATHGFSEEFFETHQIEPPAWLPSPRARTSPVSIRFDPDTLARLKAVARKKRKGYQTLLKEFVAERLYEEEKREGLVGS